MQWHSLSEFLDMADSEVDGVSGVIEAIGAGVTGLVPGDRVSTWRDPGHQGPGCYAQFVVHRAENVIQVPAGLPD